MHNIDVAIPRARNGSDVIASRARNSIAAALDAALVRALNSVTAQSSELRPTHAPVR